MGFVIFFNETFLTLLSKAVFKDHSLIDVLGVINEYPVLLEKPLDFYYFSITFLCEKEKISKRQVK